MYLFSIRKSQLFEDRRRCLSSKNYFAIFVESRNVERAVRPTGAQGRNDPRRPR